MRRFSFSLILPLLSLLVLLPALPSCTPKDPFAYAQTAFSVSVRGTYTPAGSDTPRPFAAAVTVGAPLGGDPVVRDLTVAFTEPAPLAGLTVTARVVPSPDGAPERTVTLLYPSDYGTIQSTAAGGEFNGFLRFAEALLPPGDVAEISPIAPDGSYTVIRRADGREAVFVFTEEGTLPLRVTVTTPAEVLTLTVTP